MKKKSKSGILHDFSGKNLPRDVITWHEENGYRVWVHARLTLTGYNPMSVEVQWIGDGEAELSEIEKSSRLQLAKVKSGAPNEVHFNLFKRALIRKDLGSTLSTCGFKKVI